MSLCVSSHAVRRARAAAGKLSPSSPPPIPLAIRSLTPTLSDARPLPLPPGLATLPNIWYPRASVSHSVSSPGRAAACSCSSASCMQAEEGLFFPSRSACSRHHEGKGHSDAVVPDRNVIGDTRSVDGGVFCSPRHALARAAAALALLDCDRGSREANPLHYMLSAAAVQDADGDSTPTAGPARPGSRLALCTAKAAQQALRVVPLRFCERKSSAAW